MRRPAPRTPVKGTAAFLATCLLAACSPDTPPGPPARELPCSESISNEAPSDEDFVVVEDALALPAEHRQPLQAVPDLAPEETSAGGTLPDGDWLWAKQGIAVRGGRHVELSVSQQSADDVRIGWGFAPITRSTTVTMDCPGSGWLTFPGGYWVSKPDCYTFRIRVDELPAEHLDIGIDAPCAGPGSRTAA